jgi:formamidopyrimidine-DNA glycosylase
VPELPEVETVRRTPAPAVGAGVAGVWGSGAALRRPVDVGALRRAVRGAVIEGVRRWGKFLLVDLAGPAAGAQPTLLVHLGMSGRFRLVPAVAARAPHTHVIFRLDHARELRFSDPRRFGLVDLVRRGAERAHPLLAHLGAEPLAGEVTGALIYQTTRGSTRALKSYLLDQRVIAGIGNIYASEALWEARVRPTLPAGRLSRPRAEVLATAVVTVVTRALANGGTSLRDFVAADGAAGEHAHYLWVYGREGEACVRSGCAGRIRRTVLQGRATFSCPRCQDR